MDEVNYTLVLVQRNPDLYAMERVTADEVKTREEPQMSEQEARAALGQGGRTEHEIDHEISVARERYAA